MSDQGATGGDVYLIPSTGGEARNLTPEAHQTAAWIDWPKTHSGPVAGTASAEQGLLVSWIQAGQVELAELSPGTGARASAFAAIPGTIGDGRLELSLSVANNGSISYFKSSFSEPPEVYIGRPGGPAQQVTHYNDRLKPVWGKAESVTWTSAVQPSPTIHPGEGPAEFNVQG